MADTFRLPVSSYEEIIKIIRAYGNGRVGVSVSLDELVKSSGISKFILSKNNGFLVQVELITQGNKKSPTETCKKLATAYAMNIQDEISVIWKSILNKDDFIHSMLSFVGVKSRVSREQFINHMVYSANCGNSTAYKTGAATIIEIMKLSDMICEDNGYITLLEEQYTRGSLAENGVNNPEPIFDEGSWSSFASEERENNIEAPFYVQQYTCESGKIAKIIIPEDATEDDLLGFRDMLNIALRRKFKIKAD